MSYKNLDGSDYMEKALSLENIKKAWIVIVLVAVGVATQWWRGEITFHISLDNFSWVIILMMGGVFVCGTVYDMFTQRTAGMRKLMPYALVYVMSILLASLFFEGISWWEPIVVLIACGIVYGIQGNKFFQTVSPRDSKGKEIYRFQDKAERQFFAKREPDYNGGVRKGCDVNNDLKKQLSKMKKVVSVTVDMGEVEKLTKSHYSSHDVKINLSKDKDEPEHASAPVDAGYVSRSKVKMVYPAAWNSLTAITDALTSAYNNKEDAMKLGPEIWDKYVEILAEASNLFITAHRIRWEKYNVQAKGTFRTFHLDKGQTSTMYSFKKYGKNKNAVAEIKRVLARVYKLGNGFKNQLSALLEYGPERGENIKDYVDALRNGKSMLDYVDRDVKMADPEEYDGDEKKSRKIVKGKENYPETALKYTDKKTGKTKTKDLTREEVIKAAQDRIQKYVDELGKAIKKHPKNTTELWPEPLRESNWEEDEWEILNKKVGKEVTKHENKKEIREKLKKDLETAGITDEEKEALKQKAEEDLKKGKDRIYTKIQVVKVKPETEAMLKKEKTVIEKKVEEDKKKKVDEGTHKLCPKCGGAMLKDQTLCQRCGHKIKK